MYSQAEDCPLPYTGTLPCHSPPLSRQRAAPATLGAPEHVTGQLVSAQKYYLNIELYVPLLELASLGHPGPAGVGARVLSETSSYIR